MAIDADLQMTVARRAALNRLNRILAKQGASIRKTRSPRERERFGEWYIVEGGVIRDHGFDLEAYMRRHGALSNYETLEAEPS